MKAFWDGTLMRYFLLCLLPVTFLSGGIIEATRSTRLILFTSPFQ